MTRVDGTGNVNNIQGIELDKVNQEQVKINSSFGDGYAATGSNGYTIERNIPGLEQLMNKFGFDTPVYDKTLASTNLEIDDRYYTPDTTFEDRQLCET